MSQKLRTIAEGALHLSWGERLRTLVAAAALGRVTATLAARSFGKAIVSGSVPLGRAPREPRKVIVDWVRAIDRSAYAVPWRAVCIHRGLALQRLLRRRGVPAVLCYGAKHGESALEAHVWVKVGDEIVIGAEEAGNHERLAVYPPAEE